MNWNALPVFGQKKNRQKNTRMKRVYIGSEANTANDMI